MASNAGEAIGALVRWGFGVSFVPRRAKGQWSRDRALRVIPIPGVSVEREVGLLERARHQRMQATAAIKAYFAARFAATAPLR